MHFDKSFKENSETPDNNISMSDFWTPTFIHDLGDVRLNLKKASMQNQLQTRNLDTYNLFSPFQNTKQTDYEPSANSSMPLHTLDELTSILSTQESTQSSEESTQESTQESLSSIDSLYTQVTTTTETTAMNDEKMNLLFPIDQVHQVSADPDAEDYFYNILLSTLPIWLGQYSDCWATLYTYKNEISNFITFLIQEGITTPRESDIMNFYTLYLSDKRPDRLRTCVGPISGFFKWARSKDIYPNISHNLKIRWDSSNGIRKRILTPVTDINKDYENKQINRFRNKPSNIKDILVIVNQWADSMKDIDYRYIEYRDHILRFIGYMKSKNVTYLSQGIIDIYISKFSKSHKQYTQTAIAAIMKFTQWLSEKNIDINRLL